MIFCKELKKEFSTKQEMFAEILKNKETITGLKKAALKDSDWVNLKPRPDKSEVVKGIIGDGSTALKMGDFVYPVINTTKFLDSHGDVHMDGIWDVSVKDQKNKLYYIINHDLEIGKVISYPEDTEAMIVKMSWKALGLDMEGDTQALIYKVKLTEEGNPDAVKAIIKGAALQNSVRMQYVRLKLCINEISEEYKEEYSNWIEYFPKVANSADAVEAGYFWAVLEAKIYKEGSAVLQGSNPITPILTSIEEKQDPSADSLDISEKGPASEQPKKKSIKPLYDLI